MIASCQPHFLLFATTEAQGDGPARWKFTLQAADGDALLTVSDYEPDVANSLQGDERLELLAVVRGLEALDQPSEVTLITSSRYVRRGVQYGLEEWRDNDWQWERFGCMAPIKDADLWRRIACALDIHRVVCCQARQQYIRAVCRTEPSLESARPFATMARSTQAPPPGSAIPAERMIRKTNPKRTAVLAAAVGQWRNRWRRTAEGLAAAT